MSQLTLFDHQDKRLLNLKEASTWASQYTGRSVSVANVSYLVQYGRVTRYGNNGNLLINKWELKKYYDSLSKESDWREKLGSDLNWHLSFIEYKESERTKHVHRLHPYKGKFIPQLVEYFIDSHIDEFKKDIYFHPGEIILDPFCGSGTTLVQANELGIHAVGIDISAFNAMISNIKIEKHNFPAIAKAINNLTGSLKEFQQTKNNSIFENDLLAQLSEYNSKYFPSPEYKRKILKNEINEMIYAQEHEKSFLKIYKALVEKYQIKITQDSDESFLGTWFLAPVRDEINFMFQKIRKIDDPDVKKVLAIILSRTVRSCRATTHADLATLKEPVTTTYYCKKHGKICKPIFSISNWWNTYSTDTLKRLKSFEKIRTDTMQICLTGDSREIDLISQIKRKNPDLAELVDKQKIHGIFSSPPYVGLIDYHEQHAYAYEIFGFERNDELEIGPLYKGQGKEARDLYVRGIAEVLLNSKQYLQKNYDVFLVANDKYDLYPSIASLAGMKVVNRFKRPVLNRVEKDRSAYAETIFHLKEN